MSQDRPGTAYRVETPRLVLRCWQPTDAPLLEETLAANHAHLAPWMPWVHEEPIGLTERIARLRCFRAKFDLDQDYIYGIFNPDETRVLGGTGLHPRVGPQATEIGYWIDHAHINQGLATEAAGAMTQIALRVNQLQRVEIHCAPENVRSAAVPSKLGYTHEATLRRRIADVGGGLRDVMIWTMIPEELSDSPAAHIPIQAFDAGGRRIRF